MENYQDPELTYFSLLYYEQKIKFKKSMQPVLTYNTKVIKWKILKAENFSWYKSL
jgi:hypothetical protein